MDADCITSAYLPIPPLALDTFGRLGTGGKILSPDPAVISGRLTTERRLTRGVFGAEKVSGI
jgi:hypothetical protein